MSITDLSTFANSFVAVTNSLLIDVIFASHQILIGRFINEATKKGYESPFKAQKSIDTKIYYGNAKVRFVQALKTTRD